MRILIKIVMFTLILSYFNEMFIETAVIKSTTSKITTSTKTTTKFTTIKLTSIKLTSLSMQLNTTITNKTLNSSKKIQIFISQISFYNLICFIYFKIL